MKVTALHYLRESLADPTANFRDGQWECIEQVVNGGRMLVVQRTGWGKSMVYFLATKLLRNKGAGPTLLISPLLSLMRNQIEASARIGIKAATINSSNTEDWEEVISRLHNGQVDVLLVSPERLANDEFRASVLIPLAEKSSLGLFVVDEAHCISDWGHDFRPDYRRIKPLLDILGPTVPVLATTATANNRVVNDVRQQLGNLMVNRGPLVRESLRLQNLWMPDPTGRMAWLAERIPQMPGSGIVYVLTVRDSERIAEWLRRNNITAMAYHSDVTGNENGMDRETLERKLLDNEIKVLVATVALGMGFDKPDLGFVIHFQRPGSVVHYYQQVGRAGRAIDRAYGVLLSGTEDDDIINFFIRNAFPPLMHVDMVLKALRRADNGLSVNGLAADMNLTHGDIQKVLKLLAVESPSPVVKIGSKWNATPVSYQLDQDRIEALCSLRRDEQSQMQEYMQTRSCLMQFLSNALDDPHARECGICANCSTEPHFTTEVSDTIANSAGMFLRRSYQPIQPRKLWVKGALQVYEFQGRIREDRTVLEGRALCLWGDAGWGQMVKRGKYEDGIFCDDLLVGCREMLEEWRPEPEPVWLTCVPSDRHPTLVPAFARKLADRLGIEFSECISKISENRPQKYMHNSFQQANNLDGVYEITPNRVLNGPVILFDDTVDSQWTFTVLGALLREAGCETVHPMALALTKPRLT